MVHGGLLPENILVKLSEGEVKLTDFGLSSLNKDIATESPYISPELYRGQESNPASDIWALGVIAYELIELQSPFEPETDYKRLDRQRQLIKLVEPAPVKTSIT